MDPYADYRGPQSMLADRMDSLWERGLRFVRRMAVAFGLAIIAGIGIGDAVTDNGFVQLIVTALATIGLWLPILFLIVGIERLFTQRKRKPAAETVIEATATPAGDHWQRLSALAPGQQDRLRAIRRSLETSRTTLGSAELNPDARDLCVLIDRRLPELIDRQLDSLPPDDRGRRQQIGELVDLVEQFARHCGRQRDGQSSDSRYQAEILRRRFEERLGENPLSPQ